MQSQVFWLSLAPARGVSRGIVYPAAHSVVCYSVHQATTDLLENRPVILVLILTPAIPGGLGQVLDVVELVVLVALQQYT